MAADARLTVFGSRLWLAIAGLSAFTSVLFLLTIVTLAFYMTIEPDQIAMRVDFRVFWAAGKLAAAGEPLAAHDIVRLSAEHGPAVNELMRWLYPPGALVVVTPFGLVSFGVAYTLWTVASVMLVAWALRSFTAGVVPIWVLASLAPTYLACLLMGQVSLIWMAGLLAALAALRDGRWLLAGMFLGFLTLKPQLGLMIPLALLAAGAWQPIFAALATTVLVHLLPTFFYGFDYWPLLMGGISSHGALILDRLDDVLIMISPAAMFSFFEAPDTVVWTLHWIIALGAALAVVILWRSDRIGFDTKAAGLLSAILLSTPYLWFYESVLTAAIALFLIRGGVLTSRPLHLLVLVPLWIGTGLQVLNITLKLVDSRWIGATMIPPLLMISLGLCLRQLHQQRPGSAPAS